MTERAIRETTPEDVPKILALYPEAFPEEELCHVVSALLEEKDGVISIAAFENKTLVAHVLFTTCSTIIEKQDGALLAPLGVLPSHQRQGLGREVVNAGLEWLKQIGIIHVYVLGDPAYYARFGFETERRVQPPYPISEEWAHAWQSMALSDGDLMDDGALILPKPWLDPVLWAA